MEDVLRRVCEPERTAVEVDESRVGRTLESCEIDSTLFSPTRKLVLASASVRGGRADRRMKGCARGCAAPWQRSSGRADRSSRRRHTADAPAHKHESDTTSMIRRANTSIGTAAMRADVRRTAGRTRLGSWDRYHSLRSRQYLVSCAEYNNPAVFVESGACHTVVSSVLAVQ
ncbi:hypothetical protein K466DRAFT_17534 [Polyporus arcularius HHB13444]|uniref:Uncharacterized protein n=1 Tax=Polyporus arcularius HHB13444 TaxID=1314778 RepID=A0A5C3NTU7_9APHY|nr:hypothetical protein K466DRAFT_17534 [Polyporus arcularius HHB13444]